MSTTARWLIALSGCADPSDPHWFRDADGDGFGTGAPAADAAPGWVATSGDCDDQDAAVHPGAVEVCGGRDLDCNASSVVVDCAFEECVWVASLGRFDARGGGRYDLEPACAFDLLGSDGLLYGSDGPDFIRWNEDICGHPEVLAVVENDPEDVFSDNGEPNTIRPTLGQAAEGSDGAMYLPVMSANDALSGQRVDRLDPETGALEPWISALVSTHYPGPPWATAGPDGWIYLSEVEVERFDPATRAQESLPLVGGGTGLGSTFRIAFGSDGLLYALDDDDAEVLRFDPTTWQLVDSFVEPHSGGLVSPTDLAFAPLSGLLLVLDAATDEIFQFDLLTGAYVGRFPVEGEVSIYQTMTVAPCSTGAR